MKSVVVYSTGRPDTTNLVFSFANGLRNHGAIEIDTVDIQEFRNAGLRPNTDCFVFLGILRGTGLVYRECQQRNIDFIYIDHAYFNAGYERGWMRLTKNHHTMSHLKDCDSTRFDRYFATDYPFSPWRTESDPAAPILVLPPTNAISWMFRSGDWLESIQKEIRKYTTRPIIVRAKPSEPCVDENGDLLYMITNESSSVPLHDDMQRAHCVVAFNTSSTIQATQMGIPVIVTPYNPCHPVSFSVDQIESDALFIEPPRQHLFHWLAYNQFHVDELQSGEGWKHFFPD